MSGRPKWLSRDPLGEYAGINLYGYVGNDPLNYTDSYGLWTGVDDAIAIGGGAIAGVVGQFISNSISGCSGGYLGAAVGGAVGGETLLYTANPIAAGAAGGFSSSLVNQLSDGPGNISVGALAQDTIIGGIGGAIPVKVPYNSVTKQILTKLGNGTIQNVTDQTLTKIAGSQALTGIVPGIVDGAAKSGNGTGCGCKKN